MKSYYMYEPEANISTATVTGADDSLWWLVSDEQFDTVCWTINGTKLYRNGSTVDFAETLSGTESSEATEEEMESVSSWIVAEGAELWEHGRLKNDVYWLQCLYSFSTLPFLLWVLPVLSNLVSHARPTGYTPAGECIAKVDAKKRDRSKDHDQDS